MELPATTVCGEFITATVKLAVELPWATPGEGWLPPQADRSVTRIRDRENRQGRRKRMSSPWTIVQVVRMKAVLVLSATEEIFDRFRK